MESKKVTTIKKEKESIHGNRIREILEKKGMSHVELADLALNGNKPFLSRIINGQRRCISLPIAMKIAEALKMPVEEVFILNADESIND